MWTVSGGIYASKPRPAVILQADQFLTLDAITVAPFTTDLREAKLFRLEIQPTPANGLRRVCRLMVDKVTTVPRHNFGVRLGNLSDDAMLLVNRAVALFLGIA